ncbi:MAG: hypothetical protein U0133_09995 [Gemmatimonadales bacterium]
MQQRSKWFLVAAATVVLAACSDSSNSSDGGTPGSGLSYIRLAPTAPALCNDSAGAWFVKRASGSDQEIALTFPENGNAANCNAGSTEDFLRLSLKPNSLMRRPDSTLISTGDSVFIYVRWVGNDSILFDLQPSGLLFDPANPAKLKIEYSEAGDDLNDDNHVDGADTLAENKLDIWRQEKPGDPFFRVGTSKSEDSNEVEARLNGFSRYALAY